MKNVGFSALILFAVSIFYSCNKNDQPKPVGGDLPTNFIIISDSSFLPANVSVVNGSSITFVNRTGTAKEFIPLTVW